MITRILVGFLLAVFILIGGFLWKLHEQEKANYTTLAYRIISLDFAVQKNEFTSKIQKITSQFPNLYLKDTFDQGGGSGICPGETHISKQFDLIFNRPLADNERQKLLSEIFIDPTLQGGLKHLNGSLGYWDSSVEATSGKSPDTIGVSLKFSMDSKAPE
jgi:hypothetical protein